MKKCIQSCACQESNRHNESMCAPDRLDQAINELQKLQVNQCGFRHHYIWRNGGRHLPPCAAGERDLNLLCAHSTAPRLLEFLEMAKTEGFISVTLCKELENLASPNSLLAVEMRLFNLATALAGRSENTSSNRRWLEDLAARSNSPVPLDRLSTVDLETMSRDGQLDAGATRVALREFLIDLFMSNLAIQAELKKT